MSKVAVDSSLTYTPSRDLHDVGIILLQMLLGHDVMERFPGPQDALQSSEFPSLITSNDLSSFLVAAMSEKLKHYASLMLVHNQKSRVSCFSILAGMAEASLAPTRRTPSLTVPSKFASR